MSAEEIKRRKLNYLNCMLGDLHEGEQLNYVCIENKCKDIGLLCPVCKTQKHQKHKVIPLKIFLADISAFLQSKQNVYTIDGLLNQVEQVHQKMLLNLKDTVQKMAFQIKQLEEQVNSSFKYIKQKIIDQNTISQNFPQLFEQILNCKYDQPDNLKNDIKKIIENITLNSTGKIEIDFKPQKIFESYQKTNTEFTNQLNQFNTAFKTSLQKVAKSLEKIALPIQVIQEFQFSNTLKSTTITVTDNKIANQTTNQNYEQRFVLIEPQLELNQKTKFSVKILQIQNWVGVGICFKNVLQQKSFKFDYNNLGHGSYLISCNGYSWSHSKKEDNIVNNTFTFTAGDIITVEFDPENKIVSFRSKNTKKKCQMEIVIPQNDEVYGCANLCHLDDKVEIVPVENDEEVIV